MTLYLLGLAWLFPAVLFLGWAGTVVWHDWREERAAWGELRERERQQEALQRALESAPIQRNGRAS